MIGQTLDKRYKIIQKLGSGGFGEAFLAKDNSLHGVFCVVKQLKPIDKSEQVLKIARRLFVTESDTLQRLGKHDQIPTLLAHLEKEKDFFLVQEFVDGHPLSAEIKVNQPWAVDDVVDLLASTLEPLAFAHANNVIHRDIKPDNLMRRHSDGKVVLIDFGAVKEVINSSQIAGKPVLTVCIGTPGYMPIEQASGNPKFSSDIYALGITCIQALTGLSAQELDPMSWRHLINVEADLADILDSMVHYDFNHRYTSGSEALEAVREYVKENYRISPKVPYSPPPELVNNYSYSSSTVPTRKVSIITKVSSILHLPESTIHQLDLWLESSFAYVITGLIFYISFILTTIFLYLFASLTGGGIPPEVGLNRLTNNRLLIVLNAFLSFIPLVWFYTEIYDNLPLYKRINNKMWRFPSYHVLLIVLSSLISVWAYPTIALLCVATGCIFWLENRESFIMKPEIKPEIKKGSYDAWIEEIDRKASPKKFSNNYRKYSIFFSISACTLSSLVANIISWGIASKIMGEKILAGVVFPKGDLIEQILVLIQPMSQVAIYGIMMSAAMVMFIKSPESEKE